MSLKPSFFIAFGVGFLSFLSPCILPVLPGYFAYLAGVGQEKARKAKSMKIFFTSLAFVLGFLLVLVILGATASAIGQILLKNRQLWQKIGGLLIIIFGLQTMGVVKPIGPIGLITKPRKESAFLAGASFGLSWTPCVGPILGSILVLASQSQTLKSGVGLLIAYALGLAIPMIFSGVFVSQLKFLKNRYVPLISGGTLIMLGLLLFFGQYSKLTIWTAQVYKLFKIPIF